MSHFCFSCTQCGDCCTGQQTIRLNPDDMALLCQKLNLANVAELMASGYLDPPEPGDPRPRIRFRKKPLRQCPFLENHLADNGILKGLCSLHPNFKPLICHLAPLAREVVDDGTAFEETWQVVAPVEGCPGMNQGEAMVVAAPENLDLRLEREAQWMREQ